jgi:hypothetical protein
MPTIEPCLAINLHVNASSFASRKLTNDHQNESTLLNPFDRHTVEPFCYD